MQECRKILCISLCQGVASKALLMTIAMSSYLWLKPSSMSCVSCVSKVLVECCGLKSRWVGDKGICGLIKFSTESF